MYDALTERELMPLSLSEKKQILTKCIKMFNHKMDIMQSIFLVIDINPSIRVAFNQTEKKILIINIRDRNISEEVNYPDNKILIKTINNFSHIQSASLYFSYPSVRLSMIYSNIKSVKTGYLLFDNERNFFGHNMTKIKKKFSLFYKLMVCTYFNRSYRLILNKLNKLDKHRKVIDNYEKEKNKLVEKKNNINQKYLNDRILKLLQQRTVSFGQTEAVEPMYELLENPYYHTTKMETYLNTKLLLITERCQRNTDTFKQQAESRLKEHGIKPDKFIWKTLRNLDNLLFFEEGKRSGKQLEFTRAQIDYLAKKNKLDYINKKLNLVTKQNMETFIQPKKNKQIALAFGKKRKIKSKSK